MGRKNQKVRDMKQVKEHNMTRINFHEAAVAQLSTNSAHPCAWTAVDMDSFITPKSFPLHTSWPLQEVSFKNFPGSDFFKSDIFADITVFSELRLKKATYIPPAADRSVVRLQKHNT